MLSADLLLSSAYFPFRGNFKPQMDGNFVECATESIPTFSAYIQREAILSDSEMAFSNFLGVMSQKSFSEIAQIETFLMVAPDFC